LPIYEYRCESCGHELDALQKISEDPLKDCPECGEATLRRLISAPSFRLKGSGWYETDFKSDKEKKRNLAGDTATDSKKDSKSSDSSDGKKSDAAPKADKPAKTEASATSD
jgi:putative FmdB family regulatory protein